MSKLSATVTSEEVRDCTFSANDKGIGAIASRLEYIKNIINLVLFLKGTNPYNDCKVNFNRAFYKKHDELLEKFNPEIERCIREYTDFTPVDISMVITPNNTLIINLTLLDNGSLYVVTADSERGVLDVLPARE